MNFEALLSKRELEVMQCLIQGLSYKEIADQLFISINTVRHHVRHIYQALEVNSRAELMVKYYQQQNLKS
jgi:DNA-binding CsgD family transcriptional regulator